MEFPFIARVSKIPYDIILGRDILKALKIDILYSEYKVVWDNLSLPMQEIKFNKWHELGVVNDTDEPAVIKQSNKRL